MTHHDILTKTATMQDAVGTALDKEITRLLLTGALDFERDAEYGIPQIVIYTALQNIAAQWRPLHPQGRALAKNLQAF